MPALKFRAPEVDCIGMRQLVSSTFDAVIAITIVLGVPASALHPIPLVLAITGAAILIACTRLVIERRAG